jgi:predicted dehydrogenase
MVEAAESAGKLLMPAFCHRFDPPVLFARELVQNDDLGRLTMFRSRFSGHFPGIEDRWFADPAISGGGVVMDTGVHSIDLFRYLVEEIKTTIGKTSRVNPALSVEDTAAIVLQSESGGLGVLECSWTSPGGGNLLELYGTAGACIVDFDSGRVRFLTADMPVWETREIAGPDRFEREIGHFADAVRGIQALEVTGYDGLRANQVVAEIYSST